MYIKVTNMGVRNSLTRTPTRPAWKKIMACSCQRMMRVIHLKNVGRKKGQEDDDEGEDQADILNTEMINRIVHKSSHALTWFLRNIRPQRPSVWCYTHKKCRNNFCWTRWLLFRYCLLNVTWQSVVLLACST